MRLMNFISLILLLLLSGCSIKVFDNSDDELVEKVAIKKGFINTFNKDTFLVYTSEDIEDVALYLPKENMTLQINMSVANIEDVIYMKLVDDSEFSIDKVLRRVSNISELGLKQDGYMYEPSIVKNIVLLQIYVPSIYLYKNIYKPKLIFSFKRNGRSVQESINLYIMKQKYSVQTTQENSEKPFYSNVKEFCKENSIDSSFVTQLNQVNTERVDTEFIEEIKILCK